jgi:hypothetical protein
MKLREIPGYRWRVIRLNLSRVKRLHSATAPTADVIVSFTSIESRLHLCHLTVRSILTGTIRPQRVVLWLNDKLRGKIPKRLLQLVGSRFEIRYVANDEPHLKLLPSLHAFPQSVIVTCDDDMMYAPDWLEILYADHQRFPQDIIAHVCRRIEHDESGVARPYLLWRRENTYSARYQALLPLGFAGILYPADCFNKEVHHAVAYRALAPKADDLWFKFMSLRNGTTSRKVSRASGKPVMISGSQTVALSSTNCHDGNLLQWEAIVNHYGRPAFASPLPQ